MKLKDLLLSEFINDKTRLIISRPIVGHMCDIRYGNWYQDNILDLMEFQVKTFDFDFENNIMSVTLKPLEIKEETDEAT